MPSWHQPGAVHLSKTPVGALGTAYRYIRRDGLLLGRFPDGIFLKRNYLCRRSLPASSSVPSSERIAAPWPDRDLLRLSARNETNRPFFPEPFFVPTVLSEDGWIHLR